MAEINIKLMTEEAYRTLQKNYVEVYQQIMNHPSDGSWLKDYLGYEPFETKKYTIDDFELNLLEANIEAKIDNGIALYERLHMLPKYVICNIRFWAWVIFEKAYKLAITSVPLKNANIIKNWWLPGNSRRDLMLGVISRYYFKVDASIDINCENKYALTNYIFRNEEAYRNIVFRNIGMIKNVSLAILKAEQDIENEFNIKVNNDLSREVMKDASKIGSVMLIDSLSIDEIYNILYSKLLKRIVAEA